MLKKRLSDIHKLAAGLEVLGLRSVQHRADVFIRCRDRSTCDLSLSHGLTQTYCHTRKGQSLIVKVDPEILLDELRQSMQSANPSPRLRGHPIEENSWDEINDDIDKVEKAFPPSHSVDDVAAFASTRHISISCTQGSITLLDHPHTQGQFAKLRLFDNHWYLQLCPEQWFRFEDLLVLELLHELNTMKKRPIDEVISTLRTGYGIRPTPSHFPS